MIPPLSVGRANAKYSFSIPNFHPTSLNKLMGGHWAGGARLKKKDRQMICAYALANKIPKAIGKRRVTLHLYLEKGQRSCDPDAYDKSVNDALVACGMLVNDSHKWIESERPVFHRLKEGEKRSITIILEDI